MALFAPSTLTENAGSYVIPMAVVNGPATPRPWPESYNVGAGVCKVIDDSAVQGFEAERENGGGATSSRDRYYLAPS